MPRDSVIALDIEQVVAVADKIAGHSKRIPHDSLLKDRMRRYIDRVGAAQLIAPDVKRQRKGDRTVLVLSPREPLLRLLRALENDNPEELEG